jgi:hypothetical protein
VTTGGEAAISIDFQLLPGHPHRRADRAGADFILRRAD